MFFDFLKRLKITKKTVTPETKDFYEDKIQKLSELLEEKNDDIQELITNNHELQKDIDDIKRELQEKKNDYDKLCDEYDELSDHNRELLHEYDNCIIVIKNLTMDQYELLDDFIKTNIFTTLNDYKKNIVK